MNYRYVAPQSTQDLSDEELGQIVGGINDNGSDVLLGADEPLSLRSAASGESRIGGTNGGVWKTDNAIGG